MMKRLVTLLFLSSIGHSGLADSVSDAAGLYENHCSACHSLGVAGAPRLADSEAWSVRLTQGNKKLYEHAINGFEGTTGSMPAKGGFIDLSDDQVKSIVEYMISQVR